MNKPLIRPDRLDKISKRRIVGFSQRYDMKTRENIPHQWANWDYRLVPDVKSNDVYGVSYGFETPGEFDYLCGYEVMADAEVPEGQSEVFLPSGAYAVFDHDGHVSEIAIIFDAISQGVALPKGVEMAPGPQFEFYDKDHDPETGMGKVELWLPVRRVG